MKIFIFVFLIVRTVFCFDTKDLANNLKHDFVSGKFTQTKLIGGFKKPIISQGNFVIFDEKFEQNTTLPIKSSILVSKDGVFEYDEGSYNKVDLNFDNIIFLNLIKADIKALSDSFGFELYGDDKSWSVKLFPKGLIKKVFSYIQINGDKYVKKIILNEIDGDKSVYEFYEINEK